MTTLLDAVTGGGAKCCEVCGVSMEETPLYRNGPKGQKVPWRCGVHVDPQWKPNAETVEISEILAEWGRGE